MNTPEENLAELIYNKLVLLFATEADPDIRRTFGIALLNVYFHHTPDPLQNAVKMQGHTTPLNTPDTDVKDFEEEGLIQTNPITPDAEWEKEFDEEINKMLEVGQGFLEGEWEQNNLKNFITTLLTSRDTYWKEQLQKAREEERERIEAIFKEHVPPHAMDLEDSVWLKRLLNKAFGHD